MDNIETGVEYLVLVFIGCDVSVWGRGYGCYELGVEMGGVAGSAGSVGGLVGGDAVEVAGAQLLRRPKSINWLLPDRRLNAPLLHWLHRRYTLAHLVAKKILTAERRLRLPKLRSIRVISETLYRFLIVAVAAHEFIQGVLVEWDAHGVA